LELFLGFLFSSPSTTVNMALATFEKKTIGRRFDDSYDLPLEGYITREGFQEEMNGINYILIDGINGASKLMMLPKILFPISVLMMIMGPFMMMSMGERDEDGRRTTSVFDNMKWFFIGFGFMFISMMTLIVAGKQMAKAMLETIEKLRTHLNQLNTKYSACRLQWAINEQVNTTYTRKGHARQNKKYSIRISIPAPPGWVQPPLEGQMGGGMGMAMGGMMPGMMPGMVQPGMPGVMPGAYPQPAAYPPPSGAPVAPMPQPGMPGAMPGVMPGMMPQPGMPGVMPGAYPQPAAYPPPSGAAVAPMGDPYAGAGTYTGPMATSDPTVVPYAP
jgi:hypothetical protein